MDFARFFGGEALAAALDGHIENRHEHARPTMANHNFIAATEQDRQQLAIRAAIASDWLRLCGPQLRSAVIVSRR
jgi:hypothetical protein